LKRAFQLFLISFLILISFSTPLLSGKSKPTIEMYFFYSKECPECQLIMKELFPSLESEYSLNIKRFEINDPSNYEKLLILEEKYKDEDNEIPVIVIGNYLISGEKEIKSQLERIIKEYENRGGISFVPIEKRKVLTEKVSDNNIYIAYFWKKGCIKCDRTFYDLKNLKRKYPNLVVREFNIEDEDAKLLYEALGEYYGIEETRRLITPGIFIGEDFLLYDSIKRRTIEEKIRKYLESGTKKPWEISPLLKKEARDRIIERFKSFGLYGIAMAGAIDGLNPCAMAILAFFISYLSFIGKRSREILMAGVSYSFANFLAYLLIGLGLLKFLETLAFIPLIINILIIAMAAFVIVLGFLSLYDYYLYKKGSTREIKLQLPERLKQTIHKTIRERTKTKHIVMASFTIGFLIAFQAFFCTGQVYLPTILFVSKISQYKYSAIGYLIFYNLFFIIPLIIIFLLAYFGVRSENLSGWAEKRVGMVKIMTSLLFFTLGGVLIVFIFYQI